MIKRRLRLSVPQSLIVHGIRKDSFDDGLESTVVIDFVVDGSNVSIRISDPVPALHETVELPAFPVVQTHTICLVDEVAERIVNLYVKGDIRDAEVTSDTSRSRNIDLQSRMD